MDNRMSRLYSLIFYLTTAVMLLYLQTKIVEPDRMIWMVETAMLWSLAIGHVFMAYERSFLPQKNKAIK